MKLLNGIKIIDFTRLLPGPVATHLLAQMGAEVIKIESPKRMDYVRFMGPQVDGASTLFHQLNHNKDCRNIDYNSLQGHAEILKLIEDSDVVIEQFRPGAMDAWGLGFEKLSQLNPKLVYVSLTGYRDGGAYSSEAGHDLNYLAYSGIMSLLKDEQNKPVVAGTQIADIAGAYTAVMAVQGAIIKQLRSGEGSCINVPLAAALGPFLSIPYSIFSGGMDHQQFSMINGKVLVSYAAYQCADDNWVCLAALEMKFWNNFCEAVDQPDWKRQNELELFVQNFDKSLLINLFKSKSRDEWISFFKGKDVCVAPMLEIDELEQSPYHLDAGTFETFQTPMGKELNSIALPFHSNSSES